MLANIIVFDVGSTYTKACAFRLDRGRFTFLGRGQSPTTLHDIMEGAGKAEAIIAVCMHHPHKLLVTDEGAAMRMLELLRA